MTKQQAKLNILKLKDGESWIWPESDYGKAEIWFKNDRLFLFEIPPYGENPVFNEAYRMEYVDKLVEKVSNWT